MPIGPETGTARMYVCGITPYDATHIGHANTYIAFDLLNRVWRDRGLDVNYVQNVTDIDDPLLERAAETGVEWSALAEQQTRLFGEDMAALNVLPPRHYVGAVESIPLIVDLIDHLQRREAVYPVEDNEFDDLYFAQASDSEFGSLSHLSEERAIAFFAERGGDPDRPGKKAPLDCLVWRHGRTAEPSWESLLGAGRPGWHIECTAIALDRLGVGLRCSGWWHRSDLSAPRDECRTRPSGYRSSLLPRRTCTVGWSAWTARRCRNRRATWSSYPRCGRPASTRWLSGSPCSRTTTATIGSGAMTS